jgi:phosphoglycolate phosphatase
MVSLQHRLSHKKHVIWDWNGTLLDDVEQVVEVIGQILAVHGLPPVTREQYRAVFCFPISEYYRRLGFDFEKEPFEVLSDRFVQLYGAVAKQCSLHPGAESLFQSLRKQGIRQSVLSAAHEGQLKDLLAHHSLLPYFDHVYGLSDFHAASKVERGLELLQVVGIPADECILVGDTDHDLEVGKAMGIDVLLLADGHQSYERLAAVHHNVVLDRTVVESHE